LLALACVCRDRIEAVAQEFSLALPPFPFPDIVLAALGPQMLDLAAERTLGTVLWRTGPVALATHIVPLMFAAMPDDGEFEFEYSDSGYCNGGLHQGISSWVHGHFSKLRVAGRNLSAYLRVHAPDAVQRIRYVKIDTEGFDRAVVQSIADLIAVARPYIKTEIYKHRSHEHRVGYYDDLRGLGSGAVIRHDDLAGGE